MLQATLPGRWQGCLGASRQRYRVLLHLMLCVFGFHMICLVSHVQDDSFVAECLVASLAHASPSAISSRVTKPVSTGVEVSDPACAVNAPDFNLARTHGSRAYSSRMRADACLECMQDGRSGSVGRVECIYIACCRRLLSTEESEHA